MSNEEIKAILENHWHWVHRDVEGWSEMRADFAFADLREIDFVYACLTGANLTGANLRRADLTMVDLRDADLSYADLRGVDLRGANLSGADLTGANLSRAHLRGANLSKTNLRRANLIDTDFMCVDLTGANLTDADLANADLSKANLTDAVFTWPLRCPSHGAFIGWKKAKSKNLKEAVIVKLYIPEDALRCSATTNKCRCSKARCLSAYFLNDDKKSDLPIGAEIASSYNHQFFYTVGGWTIPDSFDPDRWNECSYGIHFFMTEKEAIEY